MAKAEIVQIQALQCQQREEQPALAAGDQGTNAPGFAASTWRNEIVSTSMSGSRPTLLGFAWWRECFESHHE
ncbi:hypothetical protein BWQ92_00420 [Arthrobacter sp. QXT-31]|nr:hypothetical protein BWQ92_00420 [Arthrobacter sp. QXT-31]